MKNPFEPPAGRLSLYVHIPFCERKCNYCAFESAVPRLGETQRYLKLLEAELDLWAAKLGRPVLSTCYFGGGTPTVLSEAEWDRLIEIIEEHFCFADTAEVTVEANPNSLSAGHLLAWRDWRVTRVSVGVQSFDDAELAMMGRLHSSRQAYEAISAVLASGFSASADLMFGLPEQTLENWARSLGDAAKSGVGHISLYQLSIEQGTLWEGMDTNRLSDGYAMYRWAQWYLEKKGFAQYEIANFARRGCESRHNLNYWREGEYLGAGPGASGFLAGWRYRNTGNTEEYARRVENGAFAFASGERLEPAAAAREASVLALRTTDGIDCAEFAAKYGLRAIDYVKSRLAPLPADLYLIYGGRVRLTKKGMRVANRIWAELV